MHQALGVGDMVAGWRLQRPLGRGELSSVFLAVRPETDEAVALKVSTVAPGDEAARAAFLRRAERVQPLVHEHIVSLFAFGIDGPLAWLAMEPVPGSDLSRYTRPARLLPEAVALRTAERIALALAHAHRQGFLHRDLKPDNVLVHWPADVVKVTDFELARPIGVDSTRTGVFSGTPVYMSPEQLSGAQADARSDLYALGVTLYQLLCGHLPHEAATMGELLRRVATLEAPPITQWRHDLPPALVHLLARLLARQRNGRPDSAEDVAAELRSLLVTVAPASGPAGDGAAQTP
jgi:eukaryotic-like serine/threonine-protein kinase